MMQKQHSLPVPSYIWNFAEKNSCEPGETAHLVTGTSAKDVFLIEEINRQKQWATTATGNR